MKGIVKYLIIEGRKIPCCVIESEVKAGHWVDNNGELIQVNQSTCNGYSHIAFPLSVTEIWIEGQELFVTAYCRQEENCNYPFCRGMNCTSEGNYYVNGVNYRLPYTPTI